MSLATYYMCRIGIARLVNMCSHIISISTDVIIIMGRKTAARKKVLFGSGFLIFSTNPIVLPGPPFVKQYNMWMCICEQKGNSLKRIAERAAGEARVTPADR